jgi:primosomal protein N' (replication factor Y)
VVDADLGLQGGDLRAAERTFQLMRQVSGRAGRADKPGVALLQTFQPEHPVIRAILGGDEEAFWRAEAAEREAAGMPPYGRLAGIIISANDAASAFDLGQHLARNDEAIRRRAAWSMDPPLRPSRVSAVGTACGCWSRRPRARRCRPRSAAG